MLGNAGIVKILKEEYGIEDITPFDEIEYEIEYFNDKLSKVKIISKSGRCFSCPVYAIFDGYNMCWYGDYGFWGFNCTWKTNVMNLAYNSPYYQLEKLRSRDRYEFNSDKCETELMKLIKESAWFNEDLNEEQKVRFIEFTSNSFDFIYSDDVLLEHEDICELLKKLILATRSESEWIYVLNNVEFENSGLSDIFECEYYELYELGKKVPGQYFIILYMLSVVANSEGCVKNYGKWIKASEELPKVSGEYLVKIADGKSATTLEYDEVTKEFWDEYSDCYSVEYWQPLPEATKRGRCGVMARYVDIECDAVTELIGRVAFKSRDDIQRFLNNIPTADVVEVVRCKDCRYRDEMCMCSHPKQEGILPLTYPLDFCSYGERRMNDG